MRGDGSLELPKSADGDFDGLPADPLEFRACVDSVS